MDVNGGVLGTIYLTIIIMLAPQLGLAITMIAVVAEQLLSGIWIDHFGVIGKHIPLDASRYAAIILLIIAVIVIMRSYQKVVDPPMLEKSRELADKLA